MNSTLTAKDTQSATRAFISVLTVASCIAGIAVFAAIMLATHFAFTDRSDVQVPNIVTVYASHDPPWWDLSFAGIVVAVVVIPLTLALIVGAARIFRALVRNG